jgi:aminotransferase
VPRTPSRRVAGLVQSPIRAMTRACLAVNGINLGQGVCQMPPPDAILDAAVLALRSGMAANMYSKYEGVDELRRAIGAKLAKWNGLEVDPDREVVVTPGVSGAFAAGALALLEPGDEVILFEPYYGYHVNTLLLAGAVPRFVTMRPPDWRFDAAALEAAVTDRTRAVLVNTPANPSGKVWSREDLSLVAKLAVARDLLVFTDEIYEYITFEGKHISPATLPGMRERTVTMCGLSKTFSITGWRLGYAVAPEPLARPLGLVNDLLCVCAPTPLQLAAAKAMVTLGDEYYDGLAAKYRSKRDRTCDALRKGGLTPYDPAGAYYVLAGFEKLGIEGDQAAADELLRRTGVASVPGGAFTRGPEGRGLLRFCFALQDDILDEACRRLAAL